MDTIVNYSGCVLVDTTWLMDDLLGKRSFPPTCLMDDLLVMLSNHPGFGLGVIALGMSVIFTSICSWLPGKTKLVAFGACFPSKT